MEIKLTKKGGDQIASLVDDNFVIEHFYQAVDMVGHAYFAGANIVLIDQKNLTEKFFDLSSGFAGDLLQKFMNYQLKLIIVGDFSKYESKSLNAFILESNRGEYFKFIQN